MKNNDRWPMNPNLEQLQPYPFEKLARLKAGVTPPADLAHIPLSIGEPKHPAPAFVLDVLRDRLDRFAVYPTTGGLMELREAIAEWAGRRFSLKAGTLAPEANVLPVNGTREAIFSLTQCLVDTRVPASVLFPNPFYQIYEGATLLAGARPGMLPCLPENGFIPDFDAVPGDLWERCQLLFLCSPGNPTGAVIPLETLQKLIALADRYDFVIASDECYSEIYFDEDAPPAGLLQACASLGRDDYRRCVVFHSLSKRSNLPGLRSGFVAGDAHILRQYLRYRTYHGCAMPVPNQLASIAAWGDEAHVRDNRDAYRAKFESVLAILDGVLEVSPPDAGFYLWPRTPMDDETFARDLFAKKHITVLPGRYLGREVNGINPGANRVRMALVAPVADCIEAARRIRDFVRGH